MFEDTRRHGILDADLVLGPSPTFGNFDTSLTGSCRELIVTGLTTGNDVSVLQMGWMELNLGQLLVFNAWKLENC